MAAISTTALDLITGALRNINALEAGETPNATDSADALQILNDLMESWSQDGLTLYGSIENVLTLTPGKYQYTIGNYTGGTFTGTLLHGTPTISGVTVPSGLVVGGTITDIQGSIPANTTVLSFNSGAGTITLSANAAFDVAVAETFTYTIPGDFAITRPLRITNAFTRITASGNTGLDYQIEIINQDKYTAIGYKGVSGPWPTALCYVSTYPLGSLYFYPNPSTAGSLHLWTDTILSDFATLTTPINLPQGYARAIKKNLALELCAEFGKSPSPHLVMQAKESLNSIRRLNANPVVTAFYDRDLMKGGRTDAGWIMSGGFT